MKSTEDYSIFKEIASSREVDQRRVDSLVASIRKRNLLHVNPIVVDNQMRVIDGQHRLEAAKFLSLAVYYVTGDLDRKDIAMLNSNQNNWKAMDYITFYTIEKVSSFVQLSKLINEHPDMAVSSLLSLSDPDGKRNLKMLKEGQLDVLCINHARKVCELCDRLNRRFQKDFVFDSRFPLALGKAAGQDNFKFDRLVEQIDSNPRAWVHCHTKEQYLQNRNLSKNKINLD